MNHVTGIVLMAMGVVGTFLGFFVFGEFWSIAPEKKIVAGFYDVATAYYAFACSQSLNLVVFALGRMVYQQKQG